MKTSEKAKKEFFKHSCGFFREITTENITADSYILKCSCGKELKVYKN